MDADKISEQSYPKEFANYNNNNKKNNEFSFEMDIEENYNKLYSNFDVKERKYDFLDIITNKSDHKKKIVNKLTKFHHLLNYKNYKIIDNNDFSFENKNHNNYKNIDYKLNFCYSKNIKVRNMMNSMNSLFRKENLTYELDSNKNKVYDRLYNRGFFIKNKIMINRIKNEESFSNTTSHSYVNQKSEKILLYKNNSFNFQKKNINKSDDYFKKDETFKPKINRNSIRIVNRLQNHKKYFEKNKLYYEHTFNHDEKKMNKVNYHYILKNDHKNINNAFHKNEFSNLNINKSLSQRIIDLHNRNAEHYKIRDIEGEKNNEQNEVIKKRNVKINNNNVYEKNIKWKQIRDEKIKIEKEKRENLEMTENNKELDLPGKKYYEKYKNLNIKIFSPKKKENTYSFIQMKNSTYINNIVDNNQQYEIKMNKNNSDSKDDLTIANNFHRQIWKYINNDGKELFLFNSNFNDTNNENDIPKNNKINNSEFTKLIKENTIEINKVKNKTKSKINKLRQNKNSLEYKMKNIISILESNKIRKAK